jgi:hypothetical protein
MTTAVTLTRKTWNDALAGKSISVADLSSDTRMKGVDVASADLNSDGKISGAKETSALFDQVDRIDGDNNTNQLTLVDANGAAGGSRAAAEAVGDLGKAATIQKKSRANEAGNDDVLFIGMRTLSSNEKAAMRSMGIGGKFNVTTGGSESSIVENNNQKFDLKTDQGVKDFAASLGLPPKQTAEIEKVLKDAVPDARDELAVIAKDWAKAENGGRCSSRLVLSGHHAGPKFWGENGTLQERDLAALAKAMPKAAAQVEDLHTAGCYSGGYSNAEDWRQVFPNLQTHWGYQGSAPPADMSFAHQAEWEQQTRGRVGIMDRTRARGVLSSEVTAWSRTGGHTSSSGDVALSTVKADVSSRENAFTSAFNGGKIDDPHSGPVRQYYNALNNLQNHKDLPASERDAVREKIEKTIRLLYFKDVAKGWATENASIIDKGYAAAKMDKPDFSKMDRGTALQTIETYLKSTEGSKDPAVLALRAEMVALRDLDSSKIKASWIP